MPSIDQITLILWIVIPLAALIAWARKPVRSDVREPLEEPYGDWPHQARLKTHEEEDDCA